MSNSRTFKKHKKTNHIYNPESGLVLKSGDEKTIIGRIDGDSFVEFDETCLKLCKEFSFKYDEKLLDKISKQEQVEAVEEDEEDPEDAEEEEEEESEETEKVERKLDFSSIPVNQNQERKLSTVSVSVQERKPSVVVEKVLKVSSTTDKSVSSQDTKLKISEFLDKKTEDMKKFLFEIDTENKNKISELEETLKKLNKDYEDVKKKLKAVLSAMNESL